MYPIYTQQVCVWEGGGPHKWSRHSFKPVPKADWPGTWVDSWGWVLHLASGGECVQCSATKAKGNLLRRGKGQRELRLDCTWDHLPHFWPTHTPPHHASKNCPTACGSKQKHFFKYNRTDTWSMCTHVTCMHINNSLKTNLSLIPTPCVGIQTGERSTHIRDLKCFRPHASPRPSGPKSTHHPHRNVMPTLST